MIVETEAYIGDHDPACHAYGRFTERSSVLYMKGGTAYVYFVYGNYYCFNVVTENEGTGAAVLIRAVQPVEGISTMKRHRNRIKSEYDLTNGPAKLCLAMGIDGRFNRHDLLGDDIYITEGTGKQLTAAVTKRIGLSTGKDFPYRYFIKDNPYVTKHKFNKEIIKTISI